MPRYYFEVESGEILYEDVHGEDYPTEVAALKGAERLAEELAEEQDEFGGCSVTVRDEAGTEIGRFAIRPRKALLQ